MTGLTACHRCSTVQYCTAPVTSVPARAKEGSLLHLGVPCFTLLCALQAATDCHSDIVTLPVAPPVPSQPYAQPTLLCRVLQRLLVCPAQLLHSCRSDLPLHSPMHCPSAGTMHRQEAQVTSGRWFCSCNQMGLEALMPRLREVSVSDKWRRSSRAGTARLERACPKIQQISQSDKALLVSPLSRPAQHVSGGSFRMSSSFCSFLPLYQGQKTLNPTAQLRGSSRPGSV